MDGKPCTRGAFASPVRLVVADERAHSGHKRAGRGEMAPTIDQLEAMSDAEVRAVYNERAATVSEGLEWYREELRRREAKRQAETLERLTKVIVVLTALNAVFVVASLFA
jgi:hypothetical protein